MGGKQFKYFIVENTLGIVKTRGKPGKKYYVVDSRRRISGKYLPK